MRGQPLTRLTHLSLVALLAGLPCLALRAQTALFQESFESGSGPWSFGGRHDDPQWTESVLPTGGWNGTRGVQLSAAQGQEQFSLGWYWPGNRAGSWSTGNLAVVRFRIKFDPTYRWDGAGSQQNKMFEFGAAPDRIILHNERPHSTTHCGLSPTTYRDGTVGAFTIKSGINTPCTPSVPVTFGVWYHVQLAIQSGSNGSYKLWINNNSASSPSAQVSGFSRGVNGWNDSWQWGGFWTDTVSARTSRWVVDDFEVGRTFDPEWYPGGTTSPPPVQVPRAPTSVRLLTGD